MARTNAHIKANMVKVHGLDNVMRNLNREIQRKGYQTMNGLMEVAAFIRRDMEVTPPLIPLDTGNLRASWFVSRIKMAAVAAIIMGFSANYAAIVHERVEGAAWGDGTVGKVNWQRPGSGPKFLEAAMKRNVIEILMILRKNMMT